MNFFGRSKLFTSVFWSFSIASMVPLIILAAVTYHNFSQALQQHIGKKLIAISDGRQAQIGQTLDSISSLIGERASGPTLLSAFEELNASFKTAGIQSEDYQRLDAGYKKVFRKFFDINDYLFDMLFISDEGNVIFSMEHEKDFGSNIRSPMMKNTNLARLVNSVETFLSTSISDFDFYPPSNRPALFIGTPLFGKDKRLGTLAFQIKPQTIYEFAQNYTGLPKTGDIIFGRKFGDELIFMTPTRFDPDAAFRRKMRLDSPSVAGSPLKKAVEGETGLGFLKDYRQKNVLARYQYIPELDWGMVVKIDVEDAFAPVYRLQRITVLLGFMMVLGIVGIAVAVSRSITEPILRLRKSSEIIGQGDLGHRAGIDLSNEIGDLSRAFDRMTENLKKTTASKNELEREVNERKKTEERLRQLNYFQTAIMEHAGTSIIATTTEGIITSFNSTAEQMLGYRAEEVIGKLTPEVIHDKNEVLERAAVFSEELNETIAPGFEVFVAKARRNLPNTHEWTYIRKDGTAFPVLLTVTALKDQEESIFGFLGIATDITQRRKIEEKILKLSQAVEQSSATVVVTDKDGNIEYANPAFERISGYTIEEAVGKNPRLLKSGEQSPEFYEKLWKTITGGEVWKGEFHNRKKSGELYWEAASIAPIRNPAGVITHFVAIKEDITENKYRELELIRLAQELERSNRELNDFAYVVSHDLKAPLRGIASLTTWLESDYAAKLGGEGQKQVRLLKERSVHMDHLIDGILEYSRIGRAREQVEQVALDGLVREVIALLDLAPHISVTVANELPVLRCQKVRIQQVFQNLISNAVHYMDKDQGRVSVSCRELEKEWEFCVEDNGPGIEERHFERIFKLFQIVPVPGKTSGTGIGLSLIKKAVEMHGGRIWVESRLGQGSRFYFTLSKSAG